MRLEVIQPYTRLYENPIAFSNGERVRVSKRDPDNPQWLWCVANDAREGWVHQSFLEITPDGLNATGTRDYSALELSVMTGEKLEGFEVAAGWQWCRNAAGEEGWVPLECLQNLP